MFAVAPTYMADNSSGTSSENNTYLPSPMPPPPTDTTRRMVAAKRADTATLCCAESPALPWELIERIITTSVHNRWLGVLRHVSRQARHAVSAIAGRVVSTDGPDEASSSDRARPIISAAAECKSRENPACHPICLNPATLYISDMAVSVELLDWALRNGCPLLEGLCEAAAGTKTTGLAMLQHLRELGCPWDEDTAEAAAWSGDVEALSWAIANGCPHDMSVALQSAAAAGRVDVLAWGHGQYGVEFLDATTCAEAAAGGQLCVLKFLGAKGCFGDRLTFEYAAAGGHIDILAWLKLNGCPWSADTTAAAARQGHLDALRWLLRNGCPFDHGVWDAAASQGHLDVLHFAKDRKIPSSNNACQAAASAGHLDALKFCRETAGLPWGTGTTWAAASGGNLPALRWAVSMGCPCNVREVLAAALERGEIETVEWILHESGLIPRAGGALVDYM